MPAPDAQKPGESSTTRRDTARLRRDTDKVSRRAQRVAMFAPALELNGITLHVLTMIRALAEQGHAVLLAAPGGALQQALRALPCQHVALPRQGRPGFFGRRELRRTLADFAPDVLHSAVPDRRLPAIELADQLGVPLAVSVHGVRPAEAPAAGDRDYDGYLASDQSVRAHLLNACGLERERTALLPDAAFAERPPRDASRSRPRQPVVGWLGPLQADVPFAAFVEAAAQVLQKNSECMFAVLGDGPEAPALREQVEARGLSRNVVMVQHLYDYGRIWEPFDVMVVDSRQPAAAAMALHAMGNGLPVIGTEGGSLFDIISDGVDGLLVARDDAGAMAQRMLMLMEHPPERLRMAQEAFRFVETQAKPQDMAALLAQVYEAMRAGDPLPRAAENSRAARALDSAGRLR